MERFGYLIAGSITIVIGLILVVARNFLASKYTTFYKKIDVRFIQIIYLIVGIIFSLFGISLLTGHTRTSAPEYDPLGGWIFSFMGLTFAIGYRYFGSKCLTWCIKCAKHAPLLYLIGGLLFIFSGVIVIVFGGKG